MDELERVVFNYLPRICNHCLNPACVAACPSGAIYKRGRGRRGAGQREQVPGLAHVRGRLPVQEGLLQLVHRQIGEVHPVLPAPGDRPGPGLRALLRRAHPLHGRAALRRRPDPRRGHGARRPAGRSAARGDPGPVRPGGARGRACQRHRGELDRARRRIRRPTSLSKSGGWPCRCTPSTAPWR